MRNPGIISDRNGLTLIEVVAGLALLALLAVTATVGFNRHRQQIELSSDRLAAVELADQLLADWYRIPERFPREGSGLAKLGDRQFLWKTQLVYDAMARSVFADKIRLTLHIPASGQRELVAVEVLVAWPQAPSSETGNGGTR